MGAVKKMGSHNVKRRAGMRGNGPTGGSINIPGFGTITLTTSNASFVCNAVFTTNLKEAHGSWLDIDV